MNAEKHITMAAQMYECRITAKRILGDKYRKHMEERAQAIRAMASRDKCNEVKAGARIIKENGLHGMDALLLLAAVVEMIEPTTDNGSR